MSVMRIKDAQGNWQEVAALHGLPGTSVSITSISESTEDDGYSVVTFSDGKQLRVKNGSKGSAGEGGSGGVVTVYCQPSEDMQSFTASMTVEEIRTAVEEHKAVQAFVLGMDIVAHAFMVTEDVVLFSAAARFAGESMAVTLNMVADGTNAMSVSALGGMVVVNITTEDGVTYTTDRNANELYAAVSAGMPVYASLMGMYIPAQHVSGGQAVFRVVCPDGTVTVSLDSTNIADVKISAGGGGGGNVVAVTLTYEGNTIKPSHTSSEIYAMMQAGYAVLLRYGAKTCTAITVGEDKCVFEYMSYQEGPLGAVNGDYTTFTIAGDTVTIVDSSSPTVYPNPQPLTINGTSYDGSEAVNIDIAAGGGGASDDVYELIEKYTSEEEAAFVRTQEPDGTPYKFKALFVKFEVTGPVEANRSVTMEAMSGGRRVGYFTQSIQGDPYKLRDYTAFEVTQDKGYWRCMFCTATTLSERYPNVEHGGSTYTLMYSTEQYPHITKFASINYYPLPAGVKMEIWGVRA